MSEALHVVCPHCDAVNRVPAERLAEPGAQCGRCHASLFSGAPLDLGGARFQRHLERSDLPLVVDFWAAWCGPCRMMAPAFAQTAARLEPAARFIKVDTEAEQGLAARYGIRSIPTLIVFSGGREVARQSGALDAASLQRWLAPHLTRQKNS